MKIRPFPETTFAFAADTDSTHGFATPLLDKAEVQRRVDVFTANEHVTEIRVATYRLESVEVVQ